jgi:glyoxylase I family protein
MDAGAFVRGGAQQIHLMELPNPDPTTGRPQHGGRDRHVAFTIASIDPLMQRLQDKGVSGSQPPRCALSCRMPLDLLWRGGPCTPFASCSST